MIGAEPDLMQCVGQLDVPLHCVMSMRGGAGKGKWLSRGLVVILEEFANDLEALG